MMDEILTAIDSLSLELQQSQMWSAQIKLEKIKALIAAKTCDLDIAIKAFVEMAEKSSDHGQ